MSEPIIEFLSRTPPRCLKDLQPKALSVSADEVYWQLQCTCGSDEGVILGHPLGDLKPGFEESQLLVSPFRFRCEKCAREVEFLDTNVHGEGSEFATAEGSENGCCAYTGEGTPSEATCPSCKGRILRSIASMNYHDERIADWNEDESFPLADYFDGFRLKSICSNCEHRWEVTNIDTK